MTDLNGTGQETNTTLGPHLNSHTVTGLTPGKYYRFRLIAENLVGQSFWSANSTDIPAGVEPTRPGVITFSNTTRTTISYSVQPLIGQDTGGTDASPITTVYHVFVSRNAGADFEPLATVADGSVQLAERLTPGLLYWFRYQAENEIGLRSDFSVNYTMMPGKIPSAPAGPPQLLN